MGECRIAIQEFEAYQGTCGHFFITQPDPRRYGGPLSSFDTPRLIFLGELLEILLNREAYDIHWRFFLHVLKGNREQFIDGYWAHALGDRICETQRPI